MKLVVHKSLTRAIGVCIPLIFSSAMYAEEISSAIPEIIVTADFRGADARSIGGSISVISTEAIERREALHIEDVLNIAPNVNFSAGASRGRFIQIRGIGERSQFKDPLDSSVALIVDGVDLSGIGLAGGLMDVQQVEIMRGPQGTRFGASALAGAINIRSNRPTDVFEGAISAGVGDYGKQNFGLVLSGPLVNNQWLGRVAFQSNASDGYIDNDFLGKDNTNNIDEKLARVSLRWLASDDLTVDLSAYLVDADNGYNAFSYYNTRDIPTDDPGQDRQETLSVAADVLWQGFSTFDVKVNVFGESSDLDYGFDWDWGNLAELGYRGGENNARDRESTGIDIRLLSADDATLLGASWVFGLYWYDREVSLDSTSGDNFSGYGTFSSQTDTQRRALYGELEWSLSERLNLIVGGRWEQYQLDYFDNAAVVADPNDDLWGGKIVLEYQLQENVLVYVSANRGYKGGGVNGQAIAKVLNDPSTDADIAEFLTTRAAFDSEALLNYEAGIKGWYLDSALSLSASAFYMDRKGMQTKASVLFPPAEWRDYVDNVENGKNAGIEFEAQWQLLPELIVFANIGFLDTELGTLIVDDLDSENALNQDGRSQAHAPEYQFNVGAAFSFMNDFSLTVEVDGKDTFYFSNSHNQQSDSYKLIHASLNYNYGNYRVSLWGRNLGDEDYQTRGFYFANTPPNYASNEAYYQLGEPRVYGITASYTF